MNQLKALQDRSKMLHKDVRVPGSLTVANGPGVPVDQDHGHYGLGATSKVVVSRA